MMRVAAGAVTDPLDALREQTRAVEAGGSAAPVPVDDGGEARRSSSAAGAPRP